MVREGYSTLRVVTFPTNFKKTGSFIGESCSRDFYAPCCHPRTSIDLASTALADICSVKTICMVSGSDSTHILVTSPVNSKQPGRFLGKSRSRYFAVPSCHPSSSLDLANFFLANKRSAKTVCTVSGSESNHVDVTGPMNFENN